MIEKYRTRCKLIDPVTKEPRFGPKMMAKVQNLLDRFDHIVEKMDEQNAKVEAIFEAQKALEYQQIVKQQEIELAWKNEKEERMRLEALRQEKEEQDRLQRAAELEAEQERVRKLAFIAEQKRKERQEAREEELKREQQVKAAVAARYAAVKHGKEGLDYAFNLLLHSTGKQVGKIIELFVE